jgi:hypothetical protein
LSFRIEAFVRRRLLRNRGLTDFNANIEQAPIAIGGISNTEVECMKYRSKYRRVEMPEKNATDV